MRGIRPGMLIGAVAAVGIAGCGSSTSSSSSAQSQAPAPKPVAATHTSGGSAGGGTPVTVVVKHGKVGKVLGAGTKKLTVYMFEADKNGHSACIGACAKVWPPVLGTAKAAAGASAADLGTITRSDGKMQVTYKGHPLYFFVKDKDDGDTYGQGVHGFGADWYVLAPSGQKIDES